MKSRKAFKKKPRYSSKRVKQKTKKRVRVNNKNPVVSVKQIGNVKEYIVRKIMSDEEIASRIADYFYDKDFKICLREDADVYHIDNGEKKLLLRFRKKVLDENLCKIGIECLKKAAMKKHDNRGAAAGPLDPNKMPSYANDPSLWKNATKFRILKYDSKETGNTVNNSLGNLTMSNIIGYFDKPDRNIKVNAPKCRTTAFTSQQVDKWKKVVPLIKNIDRQFKLLIPDRYKVQYKQAHQTPFVIKGTAFSTVTINYNWQTALHTDKGDLPAGFGNLVVLEEGEYTGGCTGFPQFGVCADVRHGDFLGMDVHEWHANTPLVGITDDFTRLSMVCYLREKMIRCKNMVQ